MTKGLGVTYPYMVKLAPKGVEEGRDRLLALWFRTQNLGRERKWVTLERMSR